MAERFSEHDPAGGRGLSRAWRAPVLAVTRMLGATDHLVQPAVDGADHDPIVDCALYVDGVRQPGRLNYTEAWIGARPPSLDGPTTKLHPVNRHPAPHDDSARGRDPGSPRDLGQLHAS